MFTVLLKESPRTLISNFFRKRDHWSSPPLYPERPGSRIWPMSGCSKSSFRGVAQTFLSYNTALQGLFCNTSREIFQWGFWFFLFSFCFFGLKVIQISCNSYSNLIRHLETPWDTVKMNAESASLRTSPWVESAFSILPLTHFGDSELVTQMQRSTAPILAPFLCLPGGKLGIHYIKCTKCFQFLWVVCMNTKHYHFPGVKEHSHLGEQRVGRKRDGGGILLS